MCLKHPFQLGTLREIIRHATLFSDVETCSAGRGCKLSHVMTMSRCKVDKVSGAVSRPKCAPIPTLRTHTHVYTDVLL